MSSEASTNAATAGSVTLGDGRRWAMLGASTLAQASTAVLIHGPAFLIPSLHSREGLTLAQAGLVAAAPMLGVVLALVPWGLLTDRRGERLVLLTGLVATATLSLAAAATHQAVWLAAVLVLAGAAGASTASASGRVVVGWFPPGRRGFAMGIRQMAQPTGVGLAALTMAVTAEHAEPFAALLVPAAACSVAALLVALTVVDPPRPASGSVVAPNPYRRDRYLAHVHGVSMLLVVPQFVVWTFALAWLVTDRGWSTGAAGALVAGAQVAGALGRIGVGQLSDVVASRMRPLRWVTFAAGATMLALGATAGLDQAVAVPLVVLATVVTVADNGLAYTAVAERAGPSWSGRALGLQNTGQFLAASAVPPVAGLTITWAGYPTTFALAAAFPVLALALVPVRDERPLS